MNRVNNQRCGIFLAHYKTTLRNAPSSKHQHQHRQHQQQQQHTTTHLFHSTSSTNNNNNTNNIILPTSNLSSSSSSIRSLFSSVSHQLLLRPSSGFAEICRCATFPAVSTEASTFKRRSLNLPQFITEKLGKLQYEVIQSLLDQSSLEPDIGSYDEPSSSSGKFTQNLQKMAKYYFHQGGKLFRPTVVLLMARACNQIKPTTTNFEMGRESVTANQYKIAMISEMIHTASLVHDDVIDESNIRRGSPTVNAVWGNKMAVLVGDFILARATQVLCSIGRPNVISVMATIIEDLVKGEFMQMTAGAESNNELRFERYMAKTYSKTASLFANSCKSVAILADIAESNEHIAFEYGRSLGLAFQLIDDLLDFVSTSDDMGKPTATDLKLGLATAPVLFAAQEHPELNHLIARRFSNDGDVQYAWEMVANSNGVERTRKMARRHAHHAAKMISQLPNEEGICDQLVELALCQLDRRR